MPRPSANPDPQPGSAAGGGLSANARAALAAALGCIGFLAAYAATTYVWWLCALFGFAVVIATFIAVPRARLEEEITVAEGVTLARYRQALAATEAAAGQVAAAAGTLGNAAIGSVVEEIGGLVQGIAEDFRKDPIDIRHASDFLDYHLPKGVKIITDYAALCDTPHLSPEERQQLDAVAATIRELAPLYRDHLQALRQNDFAELRHASEALRLIALRLERPRAAPAPRHPEAAS